LRAAQRVHQDREWYLGRLARLPPVFSHLDFHPLNLFAVRDRDGTSRTVVIDWQFSGIGALGEDIGNLVLDAVYDFHISARDARRLHDALVDGYVTGLRSAGYSVDPRVVSFAVCAAAAVKYSWIPLHLCQALENARGTGQPALLNRRPLEYAAPAWAGGIAWWFEMDRQAHALAREIGTG
jgi:thiamine kinase-like enzyme